MATYVQAERPMTVTTPLGQDDLLLVGFSGHEGLSQLFRFDLDLLAEHATQIKFEDLLGKKITVHLALPDGNRRHFSGMCSRLSQGGRDQTFTAYRMEVVPHLWLLTRRFQSRIFQQMTVPEIVAEVLNGLEVTYEVQGSFEPRDYCVQYRETDFSFASRLMEEEGIYYFFTHGADGHRMVVANTSQSHPELDPGTLIFDDATGAGQREDDRVRYWEKIQELRSGQYTLRDHSFELPGKNLEAIQIIPDSVPVGTVTHKLKTGGNDKLEIYDYPGEYAQRFDGVDPGGSDRSGDLKKIFTDNARTVGIRMEHEALQSLLVHATSDCRQVVSGHKFALERHFDADGQYVITSVDHTAQLSGSYRSGDRAEFIYENTFNCIPLDLPFRPARLTPKPVMQGAQTAIVVGPAGEEIFTDKYGRIKVQFHWDRQGQYDDRSSCWIRVATQLAGRQWGSIYIPRIGQEVVVTFKEGDPDQPLIVGTVFNADQVPPYKLPDEKTKTGYKSYSSLGGQGFNEIRFEDKKGKENFFAHAEGSMDVRVKGDRREWIGRDTHLITKRDKKRNVEGNEHATIKLSRFESIGKDHHLAITGKQAIKIGETRSLSVGGNVVEVFGSDLVQQVSGVAHYQADSTLIEASSGIELKVGGSTIVIAPGGIWISGPMVYINSGAGAPVPPPGHQAVAPTAPEEALIAANADPGSKSPTYENQIANMTPLEQEAQDAPRHDADSEENRNKKSWIEIVLVDEEDNPVPGERYQIKLPDGTTIASGTLDANGFARVDNIDPGTCTVTFPDLDKDAWSESQ